ncbi:integrin beta-PS [Hyposmocoma kahamanoa]|uniref:integrin beta-PS n=1 Tax=Hyposmocoma kahamanoa TaxID=1477025 RepID=UPI000E6D6FC3|nr:integrin beta-PS [Hyposmocoma kahamanoa]XP_026329226.1 integrin beta-PS [Hyposmocoma kahamanoa]
MWAQRSIVNVVCFSLLATCQAQRAEQLLAQNPCSSKTTCSECIRTPSCAWCFAPGGPINGPRCFNPAMEGGVIAGCSEEFIFNPDSRRTIDPEFNRELSRGRNQQSMLTYEESLSQGSSFGGGGGMGGGGSGSDLVQIKPQRAKMQLRMGEMQQLSFAYAQAQDYPVDLYYLMDLSRSMKNDKEKLSTLGSLLSSTMRNITSNFRIGFGSFVDKLVMPYVSTVPKNLISPCEGCAAPYGFRNQMSLSIDTDYFEHAVAQADVSGNLDAPEGGFDAIMQAVVCKQEIGWRDKARRLLVFSTDAGFHYAGDGKLGGIVQPNDGECHMENNGYTHSTVQDYPSISQINLKVKKHAINVIFAVTAEQHHVYEELSKHIEGSSSGVLSADSDNVVDLVRDQYNKITSTVEMKDTASDALQVVYYSSCLEPKDKKTQTNVCDGLKVGDVVEFTAEITLKECPKDPNQWLQSFDIAPVGVSESLTVNVDMICDCPCEHPGQFAYDDRPEVCSGFGVSKCGVCVCFPGRFGKNCECSESVGGGPDLERGCRPHNVTTGPVCSGRGSCLCGVCDCEKMPDPTKVISGPFCECDNFSCDMNKGMLCSGPDHGECVCGKCACQPGFTGPACQCSLDKEPCRSPENGEICSGNGQCMCEQCVCKSDDEHHFSGKFCEKCPTCPGRCQEFKDCVLCEVHKRGPNYNPNTKICENCTLYPDIEEGKIEANETMNEHLCSFYDDEDCLYVFVYSFNDTKPYIRAQKERECPKKVFILGIVLGVIAAIVLVGLALLMLWKMVTTIHDRREFARFEKERMMAKWDTGENPIYKQATSTFKNPTYAGK